MPEVADYKLADLLGIAGATIAIIIAGAILTGGFAAKYVGLFERYRGLTGEYRTNSASDPRKGSLRGQIANYRLRIHCMNIASICMGVALILFLLTVATASLSVIYPHTPLLRTLGTVGLFGGLTLIGGAVLMDLAETILSRGTIGVELADFSDVPDGRGV